MTLPQLTLSSSPRPQGPVVLVIMDGIGVGRGDEADAVAQAATPTLDAMRKQPLSTLLTAHGIAVGMPSNSDMGNSEVGHNIMGAGRVFDQGAKRVGEALQNGSALQGECWQQLIRHCAVHHRTLHLLGLLSDGNVHSHINHLLILIDHAHQHQVRSLAVHVLLDGRDVARDSALDYVANLETHLAEKNRTPGCNYRIASGGGRMQITMDRYEADWPMVARGWRIHVHGQGPGFSSATAAIVAAREQLGNISDQELPGFVVCQQNQPVGPIVDHDAVVIFNFRGDRVIELCRAFEDETFKAFDRGKRPQVLFAGMTLYDGDSQCPRRYLVPPPLITHPLSEVLCAAGKRQLAIAETQKFGHVTYFWNGNKSGMFDDKLEHYLEIPSLPPPFDHQPQMRAFAVTAALIDHLQQQPVDFARINLANGDMVGHTGNFAATVQAVATVDRCIAKIAAAVAGLGGALIVTADHGNADEMAERDKLTQQPRKNPDGSLVARNSHSLNPVPCCISVPAELQNCYQLATDVPASLGALANTIITLQGFNPVSLYLPGLLRLHPS